MAKVPKFPTKKIPVKKPPPFPQPESVKPKPKPRKSTVKPGVLEVYQ